MSDDILKEVLKVGNKYPGWSNHVATNFIIEELKSRSIPAKKLGRIACSYINGAPLYYNQAFSSCFNGVASRAINNKQATKNLLTSVGVNTAKGSVFANHEVDAARSFALSLPSAVLKPLSGARGKGVSVGIKTEKQFDSAWENVVSIGARKILIEEEFFGEEARYLVVSGKCLSVTKRVPPFVVGDGVKNISELLLEKNAIRNENPSLKSKLIKINSHRESILEEQGVNINDIPSKGTKIYIDYMSSISAGGETIEITEYVHPNLKKAAENAGSIFPGMDVIGVDLMARSHFDDTTSDEYIVIEINAQPGLGSHQCPAFGNPKWVIPNIVDAALESLACASYEKVNLTNEMYAYAASGLDFKENKKVKEDSFGLSNKTDSGVDGSKKSHTLSFASKRTTPSLLKKALSNQLFFRDFLLHNELPVITGQAFALKDIGEIKSYAGRLRSYSIYPFNSDVRIIPSAKGGVLRLRDIIKREVSVKKAVAKGLYVDDFSGVLGRVSILSIHGLSSGFSIDSFSTDTEVEILSKINKFQMIDMVSFIQKKIPMADLFSISFIIFENGSFVPDSLDANPDLSVFLNGFFSFGEIFSKVGNPREK